MPRFGFQADAVTSYYFAGSPQLIGVPGLNQMLLDPAGARLTGMACVLCGSADRPTDEDVIPKWLLRAFDVQGPVTVSVREESGEPQLVARRRSPKVILRGGLCSECNNERLSRLESAVKPVLEPMARYARPTALDLDSQRLLAAWAIKTVYLLELAARQQYPGARPVEGYEPGIAERGWLLGQLERRPAAQVEPPPRSMAWLACWDCEERSVFSYAPSTPRPSAAGPARRSARRAAARSPGSSPRSLSGSPHSRSSQSTT